MQDAPFPEDSLAPALSPMAAAAPPASAGLKVRPQAVDEAQRALVQPLVQGMAHEN